MATLGLFYVTSKHNPSARTRISHFPLDIAINAAGISEFVEAFEELSNAGATEDATHPRFKVYGVTRNLINVEAVDSVIQSADLEVEPMGINGYMLGDMTGLPVAAKVRQPFTLKGLNPNFELPAGYDETTELSNVAEQFLIKWGKVRFIDNGNLVGKTVTAVVVTSMYKMH